MFVVFYVLLELDRNDVLYGKEQHDDPSEILRKNNSLKQHEGESFN